MGFIDFDKWPFVHICDSGGAGNTMIDQSTGASIIIACGKAKIDMMSGTTNRFLFFTRFNCADVDQGTAALVIRFPGGQRYVNFDVSFDSGPPMRVEYYENYNKEGLVESRSLPTPVVDHHVMYWRDQSGPAIKEIVIVSNAFENCLDNLHFKYFPWFSDIPFHIVGWLRPLFGELPHVATQMTSYTMEPKGKSPQ